MNLGRVLDESEVVASFIGSCKISEIEEARGERWISFEDVTNPHTRQIEERVCLKAPHSFRMKKKERAKESVASYVNQYYIDESSSIPKKLIVRHARDDFHKELTFSSPVVCRLLLTELPVLITGNESEEGYNTMLISHLPSGKVLKEINVANSVREIVHKRNDREVYLLHEHESTAQLKAFNFLNVDLYNELRFASNQLKELYCQAIVHRSVEKVLEEIPRYKELLKKCQPNMKAVIEKAFKDPESKVEEPFIRRSFWQCHKRKLIGGFGIAAGIGIAYGLYSWYYSR